LQKIRKTLLKRLNSEKPIAESGGANLIQIIMFHYFKKLVQPFLFLIAILLVFSSCTTLTNVYRTSSYVGVELDSYSNKENLPAKKVALMVCNNENIPKHDLKNLELESYIKKVLQSKGYSFTQNNEEANIIIFYEYGISDPNVYVSERVVPIWGQTGIRSAHTTYTGSSKHTTYTPSYGTIGSNVVTDTEITYVRWANISAFDADYYRKTGEDKMLWLTEIKSEGTTDNLRSIFPYMLVAAREYIGQSVTNRVSVNIPADPIDKRVIDFKDALVTVVINKATTGRKPIQATVYQDVYRNNELFIKAGTIVNAKSKRSCNNLNLLSFSTTSVYGNNINLVGFNQPYFFRGKDMDDVRWVGRGLCLYSLFFLSPIGIPLWCAGDYHAKIPAGTLFYLEME
jgi:hypothetical protein